MIKLKYVFLIVLFFGLKQTLLSQEILPFSHPEEYPIYDSTKIGLLNELLFVLRNVKYPETAVKDSIEGRVFVSYWIEKDGTTTNHEIIRGLREDIDQEALRVAKMIKYFSPAKNRGEPIRFQSIIPVYFYLETNKEKFEASIEKEISEQEKRLVRQEKKLAKKRRIYKK